MSALSYQFKIILDKILVASALIVVSIGKDQVDKMSASFPAIPRRSQSTRNRQRTRTIRTNIEPSWNMVNTARP